jgi:hypothetical protein
VKERAMNNHNCPTHRVPMVERPSNLQTAEQRWCGKWYDCPACTNSVLVQSAELLAHMAPKPVAKQAALFA